jgi:riboflavin kinase / FMN adenylyltransferase
MRVVRVPGDAPPASPRPVVATIGNFDGVHLGHRRLLERVAGQAHALGTQTAVITFDPHPRKVLRPDEQLKFLSTGDEKRAIFEELGLDQQVVLTFDAALQALSPQAFFELLGRYVELRHLVHGPGFALGRARQGTPEVIAAIGRTRGFTVEEVAPLELGPGNPVTSSAIRALVQDGKVDQAAQRLGRAPSLTGIVVEGEKMGRQLGFPTANLDCGPDAAVPDDGVYAAWAELRPFTPTAEMHPSAVSIGTRPTFDGRKRVVEAFLLDFDGDLYGQRIRLHFVSRLRGQERFDGIEPLIAQMNRDVEGARAVLVSPPDLSG